MLRAAEGSGRTVMILVDGAAPPGDPLELAVTAGAAVARHAAARGEPFGLAHTGRGPAGCRSAAGPGPCAEMALTRLEAGGERQLSLALRAEATAPDPPDLMLVATSAGDPALAAAVAQACGLGVLVAAVLCRARRRPRRATSPGRSRRRHRRRPRRPGRALSAADARARVS